MKVDLSRFKIKKGKEDVAEEWMKFLNDDVAGAVETMNREKMYIEAIFAEEIDGEKYLTWFSVQGEDGEMCMTSDLELDKVHMKYWKECIDDSVPAENQKLKLFLLNKNLVKLVK